MSPEFAFPDLATPPDPPPSPLPAVDPHRIGDLVNGFIAAKQDALFDAPDALYRQSGADAVAAAPAVTQRLAGLRDATLEQAADDGERQVLQTQLDAQLADALDGIDRHVTRHREERNREILSERQRLIERSAALEHNNEAKLAGLAEANASAAQMRARLDGVPEEPVIRAARSAIWRNAIAEWIAIGQGPQALGLFDRSKDLLTATDHRALDVPIQAARTDAAADAWIAREQDSPGEPLGTRSQADPELSDAEKATTLAKIEARDSARESARIATVRALDDAFEAASDAVASSPGTYRPGTLAALANAYEDAGHPSMADPVRRLAERESFLLSFARSSAGAQQRLIDSLPEGEERTAAKAIQERQAEIFARDPFAAGTALYPDVGPPKPIDDIDGRLAQARTIAAYRGIEVVPLTTGEIAATRPELAPAVYQPGRDPLVEDLLTLVDVQDNKRQGDAARDKEIKRIKQLDRNAKVAKEIRISVPSMPQVYMVADIIVRGNGNSHLEIIEVKTGEARLSQQQADVLAEALRTGNVYISSEKGAKDLKIVPYVTFQAQGIQPLVTVTGGAHATIVRQLMNRGVDVVAPVRDLDSEFHRIEI